MQTQSPDMSHPTASGESPLHESSHVRLRSLIWFAVWFVIALIVIEASVYGMYRLYRHLAARASVPITGLTNSDVTHSVPPEPRLQPSLDHDSLPNTDLQAMRERDLADFRKRGWVDSHTGQVAIDEKTLDQVLKLTQPAAKKQ